MPQIVPQGSINLAALQDPDLYVQVLTPPPFLRGVPTDVVGMVGSASWGPVNQPALCGSGQDAVLAFGPMSSVSLLDQFDLATDMYLALGQASSQATLSAWGVRVSDGTDTAASVAVPGAASAISSIATIAGSLTVGDQLQMIATSTALAGSPITVFYTTKTADTPTLMAAGLAAAINNNPTLNAAGVFAVPAAAIVTTYWPAALSPTIVWTKNVTGGVTETITLTTGSTTTTGGTLTGLFTGTLGAQIRGIITTSANGANLYNVTITGFQGTAEVFPNLSGTNFWRNLQLALSQGVTGFRGPSNWARLTGINAGVGLPTVGTYALAGGSDGRAGVTTSLLLGSSTSTPRTGVWTLVNCNPAPGIVWLVGCTDPNAVAIMDSFALSAGASALFPFPTGTSTTAAVSAISNDGIGGPEFIYVKDSIYFLDTVNNQRRLVLPTPVLGGFWATLAPQNSPLNKQVQLVLGTERSDPVNGTIPYSPTEIGQLNIAGIMFVSNPCPGGAFWGVRTGASTSPSPATAPVEYWRLTMFIARTIAGAGGLGQYVGQLQSQQPNDALRASVKATLNTLGETLANADVIDSGIGFCEFSQAPNAQFGNGINTPASVSQHYLYALFRATYLSSVWYFVCSIQGGTTVVTVAPGQA
jgi:hypothetical protein